MELSFLVKCSHCGSELDITDKTVDGRITFSVIPCIECMSQAVEKAKEEMES